MALTEVKLRPTSPWRTGNRAGDRERVDDVYHSDSLYSAITHAMLSLGWLEEWLACETKLSSLFPFVGETRLAMQSGKLNAIPGAAANSASPYKVIVRSAAAVDRVTGAAEGHRIAGMEFERNAGWWGVFEADEVWTERIEAAFTLLADSGFGGERSQGWGRSETPQFSDASALFSPAEDANAHWLLSLYSPHEEDAVDWTRSQFTATVRGGWTDSAAGVSQKKQVRMIDEGSVLRAPSLKGRRVDVAPDGFAHPVYRSGIALAIPVRVDE